MTQVPQELRDLVDEYVCGEMDADRFARLEAWLATDSEAREYFVEYWQMISELYVEARAEYAIKRFEANAQGVLPSARFEPASFLPKNGDTSRNPVRRGASFVYRHKHRLSVVAVLVLVAVVVGWAVQGRGRAGADKTLSATHGSIANDVHPQSSSQVGNQSPKAAANVSNVPQSSAVARLTVVNCEWVHPGSVLKRNALLMPGQKLELASGQAKIVFQCGAEVNLCGPAIFEIESAKSAILTIGRLTARADTPQAHGFTVHSRTASTVDLGTEFNVVASADGHSQIRVVEGSVEVHLANGRQRRRLGMGQSIEVEPGSPSIIARIEPGEGTPAFRFPTIEPPSNNDYADASQGHAHISVVRGRAKSDSGPVEVLLNGKGQSRADSPNESFFFGDDAPGRVLMDLGQAIAVQKVNSYSWHQHHSVAADHIRAHAEVLPLRFVASNAASSGRQSWGGRLDADRTGRHRRVLRFPAIGCSACATGCFHHRCRGRLDWQISLFALGRSADPVDRERCAFCKHVLWRI